MSFNRIQISKFESMPHEILLDILEYLSTYDIFQAFYYLNQRYNTLLVSRHYHIDLINKSKTFFDYHNYFLFSLVPHRILSLSCEDIFDRLKYQIHLSDFISLQRLTIYKLNIENFSSIISQLNGLKNLIYLNLQVQADNKIKDKIILQQQLPNIQNCILNLDREIIFQSEYLYSQVRYLTLNKCNIDNLLLFLDIYLPQLEYLTVTLINGRIENHIDHKCNLKSLIINTSSILFHDLIDSLLIFFPCLQRLSVNAMGIDYVNGKFSFLSIHF